VPTGGACKHLVTVARRTYETESIRVHWDSRRCIHTAICLQRLPEVFDVQARPWVDVHGASADAIAETIERCPTGALRYERLDGAPGERPRRPTTVWPIQNGPLLMVGDLQVKTPEGEEITHEGRLTLCRCGMSRNQPFCDNSHLRRGWRSGPSGAPSQEPPPPEPGSEDRPTEIVPRQDASLKLTGDLRIHNRRGERPVRAGKALLCRCGNSANKPFCDGSHESAGFRSQGPELPRDRLEAESPAAFTPNPRVPDPAEIAAGEGSGGPT
jgi:CDGSH-type Zn-finger protein/uncharacterized Fe-S cluster protein YjdI